MTYRSCQNCEFSGFEWDEEEEMINNAKYGYKWIPLYSKDANTNTGIFHHFEKDQWYCQKCVSMHLGDIVI